MFIIKLKLLCSFTLSYLNKSFFVFFFNSKNELIRQSNQAHLRHKLPVLYHLSMVLMAMKG